MKLIAIVHTAEEGGFWAEVPALPGCVTQAESREELERNLQEAVEGWLFAGEAGIDAKHELIDGGFNVIGANGFEKLE